jgi:long-chain acyl-CoA synthetase
VAIVVPDEEPVRHWAKSNAESTLLPDMSFHDVCQSIELKEAILSDIQRLSREQGLHGFEIIKDVHMESQLFSAEKDLITPTFKLKRNKLRDLYNKEIEAMYARMPPPLSKL